MTPALVTATLPRDSRLIVIGDIHGCFGELKQLLGRLAPRAGDLVISAGDMVRKGPDPVACLELWRERGYLAVAGNNEKKLLGYGFLRRLFLPANDRAVLRRRDLSEYIDSWPLAIDVPAASAAVVHGGLFPHMRVTPEEIEIHHRDVVRLRYIRRTGSSWTRVPKGKECETDVLWATVWNGDRTILYGHTPLTAPRFDPKAIGLDTGCVYGRALTAAVWDGVSWTTVSQAALRSETG